MIKQDTVVFETELLGMFELFEKGKYVPTKTVVKKFWKALKQYDINVVLAAFSKYERNGTFSPKPSDILKIIAASDGRPEAEEAWGLVVRVADESETVVWTQEMAAAWAIAQPLMDNKGNVAARMAFKQHYERLIALSREQGTKASWEISLGYDQQRRTEAIKQAKDKGLISPERGDQFLIEDMTSEGEAIAGLIGFSSNKVINHPDIMVTHKKNVERMRQSLADGTALALAQREQEKEEAKRQLEERRELLIQQSQGLAS